MLRNRLFITSALSIALAGTLLMVTPARAADILYEPTMEEAVTQVEYGTGWYLRGNISGGFSQFRSETGVATIDDDFHAGFPYSVSLGVGTNIGSRFRVEALFEHFEELENTSQSDWDCSGITNPERCFYASHVQATAQGLSLNGFIDLGDWQSFKPYIGAGAGIMSVSYNSLNIQGICEGTVDTACDGNGVGQSVVATPTFSNANSFRVMGNIQAGAGLKITDNLTLDAGYRLSALQGETFEDTSQAANLRTEHDTGTFIAHEFRVGFRYEIW